MKSSFKPRILIVDDEAAIRRMLSYTLQEAGYEVAQAENGRTALGETTLRTPDALVLDLGLPDVPGLDVLKALRPICKAPVLILSVFGDEDKKVAALDAGADDFLTKPFGSAELLARLRVLLRRNQAEATETVFRFGPIEVDFLQRRVVNCGEPVNLTATEFDLLHLLVMHRDKVLTHREILGAIWGPAAEGRTNYLRVYLMRLRRKLGEEVDLAGYFQTEARIGYRFVSHPRSAQATT